MSSNNGIVRRGGQPAMSVIAPSDPLVIYKSNDNFRKVNNKAGDLQVLIDIINTEHTNPSNNAIEKWWFFDFTPSMFSEAATSTSTPIPILDPLPSGSIMWIGLSCSYVSTAFSGNPDLASYTITVDATSYGWSLACTTAGAGIVTNQYSGSGYVANTSAAPAWNATAATTTSGAPVNLNTVSAGLIRLAVQTFLVQL